MKGKYIYGIIKTGKIQNFGTIGIDNPASEVLTVYLNNLGAVVSDSPWKIYQSTAKEDAIRDLVTHQFVIEKVMENFSILPVKFGTMVETEDEVRKFLDKGYFLLRNQLRQMEGKIELDVVVTWKLPEAATDLYRQSRRLKKKQAEIALKGEKATVEDKVALGKLVVGTLKTKKGRINRQIMKVLKKEAVDVVSHNLAGDEMVFNAAFLVEKKNEEFFNKAVNLLDKKQEDMLNFRVVGPLPPYSFSTILFKRISPKEVEKAKKTLGLNGEITDKTVNHAYRQLAQECHPDKNAGQGQLGFDFINSAYKVLKDFTKGGFFNVDIYRWEGQR